MPKLNIHRLWHYGAKLLCLGALFILVKQVFAAYHDYPSDVRIVLLLIAEIYTAIPIIISRYSEKVNRRLPVVIVTTVCSCYFVLLNVADRGTVLIPYEYGKYMQIFGISMQLFAKMALGRSFGLLPANRGVVSIGPYRGVRHPMYLGYFFNHLGFLLCTFSWYNLALYSVLYLFVGYRIYEEEKILKQDPAYVAYAQKVRYRLIPLVF